MAKNTNQSWIHRYRFHIVFRLQNSPKVPVTFGIISLDAILLFPLLSCCGLLQLYLSKMEVACVNKNTTVTKKIAIQKTAYSSTRFVAISEINSSFGISNASGEFHFTLIAPSVPISSMILANPSKANFLGFISHSSFIFS